MEKNIIELKQKKQHHKGDLENLFFHLNLPALKSISIPIKARISESVFCRSANKKILSFLLVTCLTESIAVIE